MDKLPEQIPQQESFAQPMPQQEPYVPVQEGERRWWQSKKIWAVAAVLLLLLGVLSFVPVSKLPFLRNLVYAMGYTPDELKNMSFLKALLSWNEHAKMMRGELPDPDEANIFGAAGGAFNATLAGAQNKLIDIRAVNKSLAKQGQAGDNLAGAYQNPAKQGKEDDIVVKDKNAAAKSEANAAKNGEVFFGDDISARQRDKNDGFNSTNQLKKVANPPVAGSSGDSWLDRLVDKAMRSETDLSDFSKSRDSGGTMLAKMGNMRKIGDSRAKRDMYWAWLMGRTARRTPHVILKKTLASSSFDGAELPRSVFTTSGFSGVGIKPDDVLADMDSVQKYLDQDKDCQEAMVAGWNSADMNTLGENINGDENGNGGLVNSFPNTCGELAENGAGAYTGALNAISAQCQQMRAAYENIRQKCASLAIDLDNSQCQFVTLNSYVTEFASTCEEERAACYELEGEDAQAECLAKWADRSSNDPFGMGNSFSKGQLENDIAGTFYQDGNSENGFNHDYFPGINWGGSHLIDGRVAD